jgi:hypothetical protein
MTESQIERRMCEMVRKRGGLAYKFISPANPGVPDRIVITPAGEVWFVELKTDVGRLSKIQKWQRGELEKRNANVRVICGWDAAKEFIEEVMPNGI